MSQGLVSKCPTTLCRPADLIMYFMTTALQEGTAAGWTVEVSVVPLSIASSRVGPWLIRLLKDNRCTVLVTQAMVDDAGGAPMGHSRPQTHRTKHRTILIISANRRHSRQHIPATSTLSIHLAAPELSQFQFGAQVSACLSLMLSLTHVFA